MSVVPSALASSSSSSCLARPRSVAPPTILRIAVGATTDVIFLKVSNKRRPTSSQVNNLDSNSSPRT
eukprot:scaffold1803_cov92-Amphora_coffeaeformis.AAC.51